MLLKQNFSDFNSQKEKKSIMKTAIRKTDLNKVSHLDTSAAIKSNQSGKTKEARLLDLEKTKIFNRFIEASCDCV